MRPWLQTFGALLARDIRVLRRNFGQFLIRTVMQPLLFVFVFAYVFPKIGQGFHGLPNGVSFSTVLVPGLIAVAINFQGISGRRAAARAGVQRQQGDRGSRARAGARLGGRVREDLRRRDPVADGGGRRLPDRLPRARRTGKRRSCTSPIPRSSPFVLVFASFLAAAMGLFIGTVLDPRRVTLLFAVVVLPLTFLGCIYYPWATLTPILWLKVLVLVNPMVYMSEGLRHVADSRSASHAGLGVHVCARRGIDRAWDLFAADVPEARRHVAFDS